MELKPVRLEDREIFTRYLAVQNRKSCECNFNNIFCWGESADLSWCIADQQLFVYSGNDSALQFPLGKFLPPQSLAEIADFFVANHNADGSFYDVPEEYIAAYPEVEKCFRISCSEDYFDYVYRVDALCELLGATLGKKRNLIKQFEREYPVHSVENIDLNNLDDAGKLAVRLNSSLPPSRFRNDEESALRRAFTYWSQLDLEGLLLRVEQKPVAVAVFSRINHDTWDIHFEKAEREIKGAAQVINHETAIYLRDRAYYLNREQDLGLPGLRKAKHSYSPDLLLKRYALTRKK
jgi:hypothetical protein